MSTVIQPLITDRSSSNEHCKEVRYWHIGGSTPSHSRNVFETSSPLIESAGSYLTGTESGFNKHYANNLQYNRSEMQCSIAGWCFPKRYIVIFLMFVGFTIAQFLRANLSVAIIDMTSNKTVTIGNETREVNAEFNWSSVEKGLILSAYFAGFFFTGFASFFVCKIGGVTVFGLGRAVSGVLNIISPLLLQTNIYVFFAARILEGLSEGFASAFSMDILIHWVVPEERTFLSTLALHGLSFGTVISYPLSGYVAYILGWRAVFYCSGSISLLWCSIWFGFVTNDFMEDRFMTDAEKSYLRSKIEITSNKNVTVPWKNILTSVPVYALLNELFCSSWFYSFTCVSFPLFVEDVLDKDIRDIGFISAIPTLCGFIMQPIAAYLADILRSKSIFSISKVHKIFIFCGQSLSLIFLLIAAFSKNYFICIACFSMVQMAYAVCHASYFALPMDLGGQFSAIIEAFCMSCASIGFFLSPIVQGYMVSNHKQEEWNHYFLFLSVISMYGLFMFLKFGSGETQVWAIVKNQEHADNEQHREMKLFKHAVTSTPE